MISSRAASRPTEDTRIGAVAICPAGNEAASADNTAPSAAKRNRIAKGAPCGTDTATSAGPGAQASASVRIKRLVNTNGAPGLFRKSSSVSVATPLNNPAGSSDS